MLAENSVSNFCKPRSSRKTCVIKTVTQRRIHLHNILNYTLDTPGEDKIVFLPKVELVAQIQEEREDGSLELYVLNGAWGLEYDPKTKCIKLPKNRQFGPIEMLYLDTKNMPPELKQEWYLNGQ